ncbi:MAG: hypothetical protein AB7O52_09980 [Planctomycetota bacterium]
MSTATVQRKRFTVLGGLLLLWGWILWGQFAAPDDDATAHATTATAVPPAPESIVPEAVPHRTQRAAPQARRVPVPTALRSQQEERRRIPFERSPFAALQAGPKALKPAQATSGDAPGDSEVVTLTSTVIGPRGNSAVINGRLIREGEPVESAGVLLRVHDGWVELATPDGGAQRIGIKQRLRKTEN